MGPVFPIVPTKLVPPVDVQRGNARPDLVERISSDARHIAIVAPPGYGKTYLAAELHATVPSGRSAWLSVDLLDRQPVAFWAHLIVALQRTTANIDDEPLQLLAERSPSELTFLAALCEQVCSSPDPLLLVLDDVDRTDDHDVLVGLERLVEWTDGRLRLVLTGRLDPDLPMARWRAQGSLIDIRQDDLRFDREAARRFVTVFSPDMLGPVEVDALHERVEGWPVALQVALLVARESPDPVLAAREIAGTDRLLADYLTGEVLDLLSSSEREVAFGLSVLEWFDLDLCREVLGPGSVPIVRTLRDRQIPMTELAGERFRLHSLVRELLESEFAWRDPERLRRVHRRAGVALRDRGDRVAATRHFVAGGDHDSASDVMAGPSMALVDRGHVDELRLALAQLPDDIEVDDPARVIDLALAYALVGRRPDVERLVSRATSITPVDDERLQSRLRLLIIGEKGLIGDGDGIQRLVEEEDRRRLPDDDWSWERRRAAILLRASYALRLPDVEHRAALIGRSETPAIVGRLLVPSVESLLALERGDLEAALRRHRDASEAADLVPCESHPANFELMLAAGWCTWATGAFDRSAESTDRLFAHPFTSFPMHWMHVAALASDRLVRVGRPDAAIDLLRVAESGAIGDVTGGTARAMWERSLARALLGAGRHDEVTDLVAPGPPSPSRDVLLAWAAVRCGRHGEALRFVRDSVTWPTQLRIEGSLITALATGDTERDRLIDASMREASVDGWVAPFLGHGSEIEAMMRRLAPDRHPVLGAALERMRGAADSASRRRVVRDGGIPVELSERERTLLRLLPTHLSYGQMGEEVYVSVNTVKSNLKSIYRKLGANNRDEAVRIARAVGLLDDSVP